MSLLLGALADEDKLKKLASKGGLGVIPMMLTRDSQKDAAAAEAESKATSVGNVGTVTKMKKGGMTASKRADGIAQRGKTRGRLV
jgi:hypothetical protein